MPVVESARPLGHRQLQLSQSQSRDAGTSVLRDPSSFPLQAPVRPRRVHDTGPRQPEGLLNNQRQPGSGKLRRYWNDVSTQGRSLNGHPPFGIHRAADHQYRQSLNVACVAWKARAGWRHALFRHPYVGVLVEIKNRPKLSPFAVCFVHSPLRHLFMSITVNTVYCNRKGGTLVLKV